METALLLAGGLVVALAALKLVAMIFGRQSVENLEFRGPVRALEVSFVTGEVTVRGDGRDNARVRRTVRALRRPRITEAVDDGVLRLRVPRGVVQYEIDVPAGASVVVRAESGSATVIGVAGTVELRSSAGSLEGRALAAPAVRASTTVGSIRLSFDRPPQDIDVTTDEGSVDLALPAGPYDVEAQCELGQASVGVPTRQGARCRVRAQAGSVRIHPR